MLNKVYECEITIVNNLLLTKCKDSYYSSTFKVTVHLTHENIKKLQLFSLAQLFTANR